MFNVAYKLVVVRDEPAAKEDSNQSSSRARIPFISALKARALEYSDDDVITRRNCPSYTQIMVWQHYCTI